MNILIGIIKVIIWHLSFYLFRKQFHFCFFKILSKLSVCVRQSICKINMLPFILGFKSIRESETHIGRTILKVRFWQFWIFKNNVFTSIISPLSLWYIFVIFWKIGRIGGKWSTNSFIFRWFKIVLFYQELFIFILILLYNFQFNIIWFLRSRNNIHTLLIKWFQTSCKIQDIKFIFHPDNEIGYFKIKPVGVTPCIGIDFHQ